MRPKLRQIQPQWIEQDGRPALLLRDPLGLSDRMLAVPQPLALLLALCDGTRDESALRAALEIRAGVRLSPSALSGILQQLDEAFLLDNERFAAAQQAAVDEFRSAPARAPALAGSGYPDSVEALAATLQDCMAPAANQPAEAAVRGLVSPHIDYQRGGSVYGQVWAASAAAARQADVAIVFGTDHAGDFSPCTLTRQNYATPFGMLPTATEIVDAVAAAIGEDAAFRDELHHRNEHSIELVAVWLQHVRGGESCPLVPILCGSFETFIAGDRTPRQDPHIAQVIAALREALKGRKALVIAAADFAHTGPAFGDSAPAGFVEKALGKRADEALMETICAGDADGFFDLIRAEGDRRHICGLPPIYMTLRLLEPVAGRVIAYEQAPADARGTSFVSFCGIVLE